MLYDHLLIEELGRLIDRCRQYEELYIYGAAENQELLARYLNISGMDVKGYIVSRNEGKPLIYAEYPKRLLDDVAAFCHEKTAVILGLSDKYYNEIWGRLYESGLKNIIFMPEYIKHHIANKFKPRKPEETVIEINLVDHCNLNCQMCDHFSQIAPERFLDIADFEKDISRLADLSGAHLGRLGLLGGEPLLHRDVADFCRVARKHFPNTLIDVCTNGLLLLDYSDSFWQMCANEKININLTRYPIHLDIERIEEKARQTGVELDVVFEVRDRENSTEKRSHKYQLDPSGKQDISGVAGCYQMNNAPVLRNGRIYACPMSAYIEHFNTYFGQDFRVGEQDYIDIHKAASFSEIAEFCSRPVSFCRYCNVKNRHFHPWKRTENKIAEYI